MTPELAHDVVANAESDADLLRYDVDGWAIWPLFRMVVATRLAGASERERPWRQRVGLVANAIRTSARVLRPGKAAHVAKTYSSGLLDLVDGRFRDIWFDDLLDDLGDYAKLLNGNSPQFERRIGRAANRERMRSEPVELASRAMALADMSPQVGRAARALTRAANASAGRSLLDAEAVAKRIRLSRARRRLYRSLLRRVEARLLFVADPTEFDIVAAARETAIPVIELQHGVNDRFHAGYSWTEYAVPYRSAMPVANRQFLYGRHWVAELAPYGFWGEDLRVVGSPRIDRYRRPLPKNSAGPTRVLFTSQGIDPAASISFLRGALGGATQTEVSGLTIRLHPIFDAANEATYRAAFAGDRRVVVDGSADGPSTLQVLGGVDLHVSISSAAHYEAIALGVPTVVLPLRTHDIVDHLVREGLAVSVAAPSDLARLFGQPAQPPAAARANEFFEPDALANARREIASVSFPLPPRGRNVERGRGTEHEGLG
jgi:hypothetical protein